MYLFARRSHTWMIYGLLAKQTPTEAREHPQLPHWDASWAHLQRILGASSANLVDCNVDIRIGSGFLNYINGYVSKSSDCVDFSAKEYSEADGDGAENTEWKRTATASTSKAIAGSALTAWQEATGVRQHGRSTRLGQRQGQEPSGEPRHQATGPQQCQAPTSNFEVHNTTGAAWVASLYSRISGNKLPQYVGYVAPLRGRAAAESVLPPKRRVRCSSIATSTSGWAPAS